jgi:hypothetical protein
MNKFTYTISSIDKNSPASDADDCNIFLSYLPTKYRLFVCKVQSFVINQGTIDGAFLDLHQIQLVSNNFVRKAAAGTGNRSLNVLAFADLLSGLNNSVGNTFIINNLNGNVINFQLLDETFSSINAAINQNGTDTNWSLTIELTGIKEDDFDDC